MAFFSICVDWYTCILPVPFKAGNTLKWIQIMQVSRLISNKEEWYRSELHVTSARYRFQWDTFEFAVAEGKVHILKQERLARTDIRDVIRG